MNNLKNKVVVVTGGNGLLGKAMIKTFDLQGAITINIDVTNKTNIKQKNIYCDITNQSSIEESVSNIYEYYGKIDGWVNNAYPKTFDWNNNFEKITIQSWNNNVDWQLNSIFNICQKVLPIMSDQGYGSMINMGSIYGVVAPDFKIYDGTNMTMPAAYSAIKGGLIQFSKYLASYYGKNGVRINIVSPGGVTNGQEKTFIEKYNQKTPLRRMGKPEDIANAVSFLLSENSSYITGHNLIVDGGFTII